jgi:hypothetical protein
MGKMDSASYAILRKDGQGASLLVEEVSDIEAAKARVLHHAERFPAEYLIAHHPTSRIVAQFHFKHSESTPVIHESALLEQDSSATP